MGLLDYTHVVSSFATQSSDQVKKQNGIEMSQNFSFFSFFVFFLHKSSKEFFQFCFSLKTGTFHLYGDLIQPQVTESCNNVHVGVSANLHNTVLNQNYSRGSPMLSKGSRKQQIILLLFCILKGFLESLRLNGSGLSFSVNTDFTLGLKLVSWKL